MDDKFELKDEYDFSNGIRGKFISPKIIDEKWAKEVEDRLNAANKGLIEKVSMEEVFSKVDK